MTYQKDGIFVECSEAKYRSDYKRFGYEPVEQPAPDEPVPAPEETPAKPTKKQVKKDA